MIYGAVLYFGFTLVILVRAFAVWRRRNWPSVTGTVEKCRFERSDLFKKRNPVWDLKVKYRYRVGDEDFHGDRIVPMPIRVFSERDLEKQQVIYGSGREVTIFYDPVNPRRAVLKRPVAAWRYSVLFLVAAVWVCFYFLLKEQLTHW